MSKPVRLSNSNSNAHYPAISNHQPASDPVLSNLITPADQYFNHPVPHVPLVNRDYWSLMLTGLVNTPLIISYPDLLALPAVEVPVTVACGAQNTEKTHMVTAVWRGVALHTLLEEVRALPAARWAALRAADDYITSIPVAKLNSALLAYSINGQPLSPQQGYPARLIVPGLYGYKMPRWLRRIELTTEPVAGHWERRGWSMTGEAQPVARIDAPSDRASLKGAIHLQGIAYAGAQTITRVEVSIDDSPWMPVPFSPTVANCCVHWTADWTPTAPADYQINVRALTADQQSPLHSITIHAHH
jgi:DMSO/TMAO reductase YedYZ molybdopterin-dependent catalytic subunit